MGVEGRDTPLPRSCIWLLGGLDFGSSPQTPSRAGPEPPTLGSGVLLLPVIRLVDVSAIGEVDTLIELALARV